MNKWSFDPELLTLYNEVTGYEVDLEEMDNSAEVLDWIFQIAGKWPPDRWDVGGFVLALNDAIRQHFGNNGQGVFCPFGAYKKGINWRKRKKAAKS